MTKGTNYGELMAYDTSRNSLCIKDTAKPLSHHVIPSSKRSIFIQAFAPMTKYKSNGHDLLASFSFNKTQAAGAYDRNILHGAHTDPFAHAFCTYLSFPTFSHGSNIFKYQVVSLYFLLPAQFFSLAAVFPP